MKQSFHRSQSRVAAAFLPLWAVIFAIVSSAAQPAKKEQTIKVDGETFVIPAEAAQGNANQLLLQKFDLNKDGRIDEAEIAAAQAKAGTNKVAAPTFSKVEEGSKLSLKDLYEGGDPAKRRKTGPIGSDDFLKQYDLNGDGQLDAAEFEAIKRDLGKKAPRDLAPDHSPPPPARPLPAVKEPLK